MVAINHQNSIKPSSLLKVPDMAKSDNDISGSPSGLSPSLEKGPSINPFASLQDASKNIEQNMDKAMEDAGNHLTQMMDQQQEDFQQEQFQEQQQDMQDQMDDMDWEE